MPRVDIWIRKADLPAWEAIEDKPLFIHNMLNGKSEMNIRAPEREPAEAEQPKPKVIKTKSDAEKAVQPFFKEPRANKRKSTAGIHYKPTSDWGA